MTRTVSLSPVDSQGHIALDMRVSPSTGEDLAAEIAESVSRSQLFITQTLPDRLVLTQKQFASLDPYMQVLVGTEDRLYVTPHNAMEVVIDREIDTVQEIENVIVDTENLKRQREEDQGGNQVPDETAGQ